MDDRFVWTVRCHMNDQWPEPQGNWPPYWFDKNSYSAWAAEEIIELLKNRNTNDPSIVVTRFKNKMDRLSCVTYETRGIFTTAREAADEILDLFNAMK